MDSGHCSPTVQIPEEAGSLACGKKGLLLARLLLHCLWPSAHAVEAIHDTQSEILSSIEYYLPAEINGFCRAYCPGDRQLPTPFHPAPNSMELYPAQTPQKHYPCCSVQGRWYRRNSPAPSVLAGGELCTESILKMITGGQFRQ